MKNVERLNEIGKVVGHVAEELNCNLGILCLHRSGGRMAIVVSGPDEQKGAEVAAVLRTCVDRFQVIIQHAESQGMLTSLKDNQYFEFKTKGETLELKEVDEEDAENS